MERFWTEITSVSLLWYQTVYSRNNMINQTFHCFGWEREELEACLVWSEANRVWKEKHFTSRPSWVLLVTLWPQTPSLGRDCRHVYYRNSAISTSIIYVKMVYSTITIIIIFFLFFRPRGWSSRKHSKSYDEKSRNIDPTLNEYSGYVK